MRKLLVYLFGCNHGISDLKQIEGKAKIEYLDDNKLVLTYEMRCERCDSVVEFKCYATEEAKVYEIGGKK